MNEHDYNHPLYINTPYFVLQDEKLSFFNKFLFSLFWSFSLSGKKIKTSNDYLATLFQVDSSYIGKCIKELEDMGYIKRLTLKYKRIIQVLHIPYDPIERGDMNLDHREPTDCKQNELHTLKVVPSIKNILPPPDTSFMSSNTRIEPPPIGGTDIKAYNKDNKDKRSPETPSANSVDKISFLTQEEMINDNPHNIDPKIFEEWLFIRKRKKAPLTHTAWNRTNKVLTKLVNSGLDAIDCFERMVANGWQGMEYKYFEQEIKSTTVTSKADTDKEIRARELKAQEMKRQEFETSNGIMKSITHTINFEAELRRAEEERQILGMDRLEYHNYTMQQHKQKTMTG